MLVKMENVVSRREVKGREKVKVERVGLSRPRKPFHSERLARDQSQYLGTQVLGR